MDKELRNLRRHAFQGDSVAQAQYCRTLLQLDDFSTLCREVSQIGGLDVLFGGLRYFDPEPVNNVALMTRLLQTSCTLPIYPSLALRIKREALYAVSHAQLSSDGNISKWVPWHGYAILGPSTQNYYTDGIRNGYLNPPPPGGNIEDWRQDQAAILCIFLNGMLEQTQMGSSLPVERGSVNIVLDMSLGDPSLCVSWPNYDDYLPAWGGIEIEQARVSGEPGQILGSYRILPAQHNSESLFVISTSLDPALATADKSLQIVEFPEIQLHIIPCHQQIFQDKDE